MYLSLLWLRSQKIVRPSGSNAGLFVCHQYTGHFITYSGITKNYYRKTVGHVFTKRVQMESTTQSLFSPVSCFSSWFTFLPLGDASLCSEKMAAPKEKLFCVLEYHTSKSVVTVQREFRA